MVDRRADEPAPHALTYWANPSATSLYTVPAIGAGWTWKNAGSISFADDVARHRTMLGGAGLIHVPSSPLYYFNAVSATSVISVGSSAQDMKPLATEYYDRLDETLSELAVLAVAADPPVEAGAVASAQEVVRQIRGHQFPPPEITWHGGDAVVMLWAFGPSTCAVTVTDGEVGYVIRNNRKQVALEDSIDIKKFKLIEHTPDAR